MLKGRTAYSVLPDGFYISEFTFFAIVNNLYIFVESNDIQEAILFLTPTDRGRARIRGAGGHGQHGRHGIGGRGSGPVPRLGHG